MPSYRDKYGEAAPDQGTAGLSLRERNHIRSKLGISNIVNGDASSLYERAEATMLAFSQEIVDEARALYKSLDRVGDKTSKLEGGSKGIFADKSLDRGVLRRELMNIVLPSNEINLAETIASGDDEAGVDEIVAVPARFGAGCPTRADEYGLADD